MSELIDNRAQRIQALKDIIRKLHAGEPPESVKARLERIVRETDYSEIVAMEQDLMAEGMPVEQIQCMCDLHSQVTREVLVQLPPRAVPPGHPADTLRRENEALRGVLLRMRQAMTAIQALPDGAEAGDAILQWRLAYNDLSDIEKHYQRKEHAFFSALERNGVTGPSKVMWAKDDEVRGLLKDLGAALGQQDVRAGEWKLVAATAGEALAGAVEEMIYKEDSILLPLCLDTFTEEDWAGIWASSPRYGWCLVEPRDGYRPPESSLREGVSIGAGEAVQLPTGNLTVEQLTAIFSTLPVDITFVDAEDRVAFFSEGPDRVFARSRAILGRKVQHCHPPRSVDVVDRILADFREGTRSVAEFWINFTGRFVHIRYFAVRDAGGRYAGTLEVTQDLTRLRTLEGERRLLQYDDVSPEVPAR
ncbi:MAG: DUF438 domain-containing protein [Bryobacterales bacterium]|nr:DUF438 domain-containing protein [Bryobacterales bacterium]